MPPRELDVPPQAAGMRLDAWLASALKVSRTAAAALADSGSVLVDGNPQSKGARLHGGEHVQVAEPSRSRRPSLPRIR